MTSLFYYILNPLTLVFIGIVVYLVVRRRGEDNGITAYETWITYFYSVIAVSVIVALVGLAYLLYVGLAEAYGDSGGISGDLKLGFTLLGTSSAICAIHVYGRRAVENGQRETLDTIRRAFLFFMLLVFSIAGLVTFPLAVYATVDHYIDDSDDDSDSYAMATTAVWPVSINNWNDEVSDHAVTITVPELGYSGYESSQPSSVYYSDYRDYNRDNGDPSQELAAALVVLPMWVYYGFRVKRELWGRHRERRVRPDSRPSQY